MQYHTYIDSSTEAGSTTISGISTQGSEYGVGISSDFQVFGNTTLGITSVTSLNVSGISTLGVVTSGNIYSAGIVTSTGGFISVANTTPIQVVLEGNQLIFSAVGIGSTTLILA